MIDPVEIERVDLVNLIMLNQQLQAALWHKSQESAMRGLQAAKLGQAASEIALVIMPLLRNGDPVSEHVMAVTRVIGEDVQTILSELLGD